MVAVTGHAAPAFAPRPFALVVNGGHVVAWGMTLPGDTAVVVDCRPGRPTLAAICENPDRLAGAQFGAALVWTPPERGSAS